MDVKDVIIVGGGPAGLNAAVVLGRCRRNVLVFDTGKQRNRSSHGMHNYLTRDDILPTDFLKTCYAELKKYDVKLVRKQIVNARKSDDNLFVAKDEDGKIYYSKKMLIATGLSDNVPEVKGLEKLYGKSVFHCPYCDGWEVKDKKLGVYAKNKDGYELALALKCWSNDVTLYTDGGRKLKASQKKSLAANGIKVVTSGIKQLKAAGEQLQKILFTNGESADCEALFFVNGFTQHCDLAEVFGCDMSKKGVVLTNRMQQTNTPGLYVAGDASRDMHFVVVAAAEGAKAGVSINKELIKESMVK